MAQETRYRSITVKTEDGQVRKFTGEDVRLGTLAATGTHYVRMGDEVLWTQRVENGWKEGVELTLEPFESEGSKQD
ncbi:hypothetical protein [Nocardia flavorosea]|uniref:Uncharacterized protein n=1 Tax=Nocardia flavorosea TaxID=53429 RepID=A0A846YTT3_9NOCA|nr:hypothetical protein [Nocardia flavorosea]NKY60918.1 hypothetical protein [Nocardia flavorosea]